jgi:hypothetical protein
MRKPHPPSVLLIREWEGQTSGSGCCGRLEGDLPFCEQQTLAPERRAVMERMGPLYQSLRRRFGPSIELEVVDPRNVSLLFLLIRDFWRYRVGFGTALRTISRIPIQAVVLNGRIVARGQWPDPDEVARMLEREGASPREENASTY